MILITGASSGIGEACARAFAEIGHDLILVARRKDRIEALSRELSLQFQIETLPVALDVQDRAAIEVFARDFRVPLSRTRVLINNAGLARGMDFIQDGNLDDWDRMIDTNLKGLLYMTRTVLPYLQTAKNAHIVNLGSVAGHSVYPKGNVYCATKHAVRALTEALRVDLHGSGIRVTEISPGMVETEFSRVRLGDEKRSKAVYEGMTALSPSDIAEAIVWSVSRPAHVNIQEIILYPTDQASPTMVSRRHTPETRT